VTLDGLNEKVMPVAAGETVAESATDPAKFWLVRDIADVAELPATKLEGVAAPADIVKSATVTVTIVEFVAPPPVAVTVTVYTPALPLHERADV